MSTIDGPVVRNSGNNARRHWEKPLLRRFGYLREIVQEGGAQGKSGFPADGTTSGSDESMIQMN